MARQKINQISPLKDARGSESDIFRRYRYAFLHFLDLNNQDEFYIPDPETEEKLAEVKCAANNTLTFLIGYTGIGKSTVLRNYFHFKNSAPSIDFQNQLLLFPHVFNGQLEKYKEPELTKDLARRIDAACTVLENSFPSLKSLFYSEEGKNDFFNYISHTNPQILEHVSYLELMCNQGLDEQTLRLDNAQKEDPLIFSTTKLKYYLGRNECPLNKIIVILDDIEPLSIAVQKMLIMQYSRLFHCLKNVSDTLKQKDYLINIIFSVRPHTYRYMQNEFDFRAFFVNNVILKPNMIDLTIFFREKVKQYETQIPHANQDSWDQANKALKILCTKFHSYYQNQIKNLSIGNTRTAIEVFKSVMENRVWVEKNIEKTSTFTIDMNDYVFNNITVTRAISCGHNFVYSVDEKNPNIIPNILQNTETDDQYIFGLLLLAYFTRNNYETYNDAYGPEAIHCYSIIQLFDKIFPDYPDLKTIVWNFISSFYKDKIFRKGINDIEETNTSSLSSDESEDTDNTKNSSLSTNGSDNSDNTKDSPLSDSSVIYLTSRGYEIRRMISSDSVYFELCREDLYRDYSGLNNPKSSFELYRDGQQMEIFRDLSRIILDIALLEREIISYSVQSGTVSDYKKYFSERSICRWFYEGVRNSVEFSSFDDAEAIFETVLPEIRINEDMLNGHR